MGSDDTYAMGMTSKDVLESESDASSESEPDPHESLWKNLHSSMCTSVFERTERKEFLPQDAFEKIFKGNVAGPTCRRNLVLEVMGIDSSRPNEDDRALADYILDSAQKVFLIAVYIRLEQIHAAMELFKVSQYEDIDLPVKDYSGRPRQDLSRCHPFEQMETVQRKLRRKDGVKNRMRIWNIHTIIRFQDSQWIFLTPIISARDQQRNLDDRCPIPFTTKNTQQSRGAHGIVDKYTIHPAHFKNSLHQVIHVTVHDSLGCMS